MKPREGRAEGLHKLTDVSLGARSDAEVAKRLDSLLTYVEQVVRLDERPIMRLAEHKLPNAHAFIVHQHAEFLRKPPPNSWMMAPLVTE